MSYGDSNFIKVDEEIFDKKSETNEKVHNRTPHTSFFKKLYGNLESDEKELKNANQDERVKLYCNDNNNQAISVASDLSAGSSSSENVPRCVIFK